MTEHTDIEAISAHINRHIGKVKTVLHELVSDDLHVDIHHVPSSFTRKYEILVTSGMSALPMAVPEDVNAPRRAEIIAILPKGWPLTKDSFGDEANYWPLRLMKTLARLPHYGKTWLGFGHTIANAQESQVLQPYAHNTALCAAGVLPSSSLGEKAWILDHKTLGKIAFWSVVPLHRTELEFKMANGIDPLLDLFDQHGVTDKIDPGRKAVV